MPYYVIIEYSVCLAGVVTAEEFVKTAYDPQIFMAREFSTEKDAQAAADLVNFVSLSKDPKLAEVLRKRKSFA